MLLCTVLVGLLLAGGDDILCLQDGRIFDGVTLRAADNGVQVVYQHGEIFVPQELVREVIRAGASDFVPRTPEEHQKVDAGLLPYRGRWLTPAKRERAMAQDLAARRAEVQEMQELRRWRNRRTEKTKHFEFEYTVPPHIFERYRDLMEAYFSAFCKQWKVRPSREIGRLKVCFYGDRDSFHQVSGAGGSTLGYFRFVEPLELNIFYDRLDPAGTEEVMFHEANHYLQHLIQEDFHYPHFPGESVAEYYGSSAWDHDKKKLTTGLPLEWRLAQIEADIAADERVGLQPLIERADDRGMFAHYTWGWSLVHYLMNHGKHSKRFMKFVIGLARDKGVSRVPFQGGKTVRGAEVWRLFQRHHGIKKAEDIARMESEWYEHVDGMLAQLTLRGREQAGMAAATRQYPPRPIRARRLLREAIEAGSENPLVYHTLADLLVDKSEYDEALEMWAEARALDPLGAYLYAGMARAHAEKDQPEESLRLARLAREIDPEIVWEAPGLRSLLEEG